MITKKFCMTFLPYDYEGIEKELSRKSSEGWQLVKTGELFWTFVQGECNEFQYNVTYIPEASEYRAEDSEHQVTLDDYCSNVGWERVCSYKKIQIYRNRDFSAVPIDTDEGEKLQMVHQAVKKWLLFSEWLWVLFFGLLLTAVTVVHFQRNDPMTFELGRLFFFLIITFAWKAVSVINYYVWYHKSKKRIAETGKGCSAKWADIIDTISTFVFLIAALWDTLFFEIKSQEDIYDWLVTTGFVMFYSLNAVWIRKLCRYIGWPTILNRIFTIVCSALLSIYCSILVAEMIAYRFMSL